MRTPLALALVLALAKAPETMAQGTVTHATVHSALCNCGFRDALTAKGYDVTYTEVVGGKHAVPSWRRRFATDLVAIVARLPM